jgi:hypothetical protein
MLAGTRTTVYLPMQYLSFISAGTAQSSHQKKNILHNKSMVIAEMDIPKFFYPVISTLSLSP